MRPRPVDRLDRKHGTGRSCARAKLLLRWISECSGRRHADAVENRSEDREPVGQRCVVEHRCVRSTVWAHLEQQRSSLEFVVEKVVEVVVHGGDLHFVERGHTTTSGGRTVLQRVGDGVARDRVHIQEGVRQRHLRELGPLRRGLGRRIWGGGLYGVADRAENETDCDEDHRDNDLQPQRLLVAPPLAHAPPDHRLKLPEKCRPSCLHRVVQ
mmetsp:Transcript_145331/g.352845  ORF Transcript_145331/g.352845 Transcript_145331/m.352845 type:complete len:212 (+) Transcript_145331:1900-2535(+)